jgi:hypothetical protein
LSGSVVNLAQDFALGNLRIGLGHLADAFVLLIARLAGGGLLGASLPQCRNLTRKARLKGGEAAAAMHARRADDAYAEEVYPRIKALDRQQLSLRAIARTLNDEATRR